MRGISLALHEVDDVEETRKGSILVLISHGDEEGRNGCTLIVGWGVGRRVRIGNIGGMCHGILSKLVMTGGCWS